MRVDARQAGARRVIVKAHVLRMGASGAILTHKVEIALGCMIISNIYTTLGYFLHQRMWARIQWGKDGIALPTDQ